MVGDGEGNVSGPDVSLESGWGAFFWRQVLMRRAACCRVWWRTSLYVDELLGVATASPVPSSSYTHPLRSVGWRNRSGIFVDRLDESGQVIDQRDGFFTAEAKVDHARGIVSPRSDR